MTVSSVNAEIIDDKRARRNALVLAISQALYGSTASILITLGGLVGYTLATDKSLATLPITFFVLGSAISTVPSALLMRKIGRRPGFIVGSMMGGIGACLATVAIWIQSFQLFCIAALFLGGYQASAGYYRFAAADIASDEFKSKAVSWVLVGGLASAFIGPMLVIWTRDMFPQVLYAGAFVAMFALSVLASLILGFVDIPHVEEKIATQGARPLREILSQTKLRIAIICCMVSYATMNLVMTATPLAMIAHEHGIDDAAIVIQWHIVAMYAPGFFTGYLINRFGKETIIATGLAFLAISGLISLSGFEWASFWFALVFLGVGWNFGFIGGTTLVLECYQVSERNKVQAATDFSVFAAVALASFTSGSVLNAFGWEAVQYVMFPMVGIAFCLIMVQRRRSRQEDLG